MHFDLVAAHDPKWARYLEEADHDFFHTAEYHRLWERSGHGRAYLAVYGSFEKFVAWPYLLNPAKPPDDGGETDVTSVYGYAGPVASGCRDGDEMIHAAWRQFVGCWRDQGVISVFARLHPILENERFACGEPDGTVCGPGIVRHGQTVGIDLTLGEEETWRNYRKKLRQNLRRAFEAGIETVFDAEWRYLDDFLTLYSATMKRNHACPFYFFSREYFEGLKDALGMHGGLVALRYRGRTIAACLIIEYHGIASTHLSASNPECDREIYSAKLLLHEVQSLARRRGNRVLHLGGGRGSADDDSLFEFKSAFSPLRYRFSTARWILEKDRYDRLTRARAERAKRSGVELQQEFFPAYRAPFAAIAAPASAAVVGV